MTYTFSNLSPADFEDLVRDLIGNECGFRFEAFGPGPDGGMDGRHASAKGTAILQAKHYAGSTLAALKSSMKRERKAIDRLKPTRYILATSLSLSDKAKTELATTIGESLKSKADLLSKDDLNGLLRKFPETEKVHLKLWLSSTAVLERIVRAAFHEVTAILKAEIEAKVLVYAQNPSLKESRDKIESQRVLIISGLPGVGKTTLGEMLSYAYISEGWQFHAIRSLDDGFASIDDRKKQIFFFDDFLGKVALDVRALSNKDSDLARFIKRVRNSSNARFILTTRAPIFEEARRLSEHLADKRLDISKYVLDVGIYNRRIRARILYNHLFVSNIPTSHLRALFDSGNLPKIVDHKNYNPRVIEWMTDALHITGLSPVDYPSAFMQMLANPSQLWDTAFRTQIPEKCRHLILVLYFFSEYGAKIEELKAAYTVVHPHLCAKYGLPSDPKDFEESLKILEGGFVKIVDQLVSLINPSLRDYLRDYIDDDGMLKDFAIAYPDARWAKEVWRQGNLRLPSTSALRALAGAFYKTARAIVRRPKSDDDYNYGSGGLSNSGRIDLLLQWCRASGDDRFGDLALAVSKAPAHRYRAWLDGTEIVDCIKELLDEDYYGGLRCAAPLRESLTTALISILNISMASDDLENIADAIESAKDILDGSVQEALTLAIRREIEATANEEPQSNSESTLTDHIVALEKLGRRIGMEETVLGRAAEQVSRRIAQIEDETPSVDSPEIKKSPFETDAFDDADLQNLFALLDQ